MSATRPPSREDQERMLEAERARLRRIGLTTIGVVVAVIVIGFLVLGGSQDDEKPVLIVFAQGAERVDVEDGDFVRVTGTIRRAIEDSRYDDESSVALFADKVAKSQSGDSSKGLAKVEDLRGDSSRLGDEVTVVGEVQSVDPPSTVLAISEP